MRIVQGLGLYVFWVTSIPTVATWLCSSDNSRVLLLGVGVTNLLSSRFRVSRFGSNCQLLFEVMGCKEYQGWV